MYQIVKFLFPFADNFKKAKPRPSLVISASFGKHNQTILAYITTDLTDVLETDVVLKSSEPYFFETGLRQDCVIKLHRVITVTSSQIGEVIGELPALMTLEVQSKLKKVFKL